MDRTFANGLKMEGEFVIVIKTEDEERELWNLLEKACLGEKASWETVGMHL